MGAAFFDKTNQLAMYFLDNTMTGEMTPIEDVKEAIDAYDACQMECELTNEDGELIASKDFIVGMDGDELDSHWQGDDAVGTSKWMQKEWIAANLKKVA